MAKKQKMPALLFFPGDWLKDPAVRCVSLAARGLWMDMLALMYESPKRGYLSLKSGKAVHHQQLARMVGGSVKEVKDLLAELEDCGVFSIDGDGVIFSRRMVNDEIVREQKSRAGKEGMKNRYKSVITEPITEPQQKQNKEITPLEYEYENETVIEKSREISSCEIFEQKDSVNIGWEKIPYNRQRGKGNFSKAWIEAVVHRCVDPVFAADGLAAYYDSPEGKGKYFRVPATAVRDEVWNEDRTQWGDKRGEIKFPESTFDHNKIIAVYCSKEENKKNVKMLKEQGLGESAIAYRIWKKHPDILEKAISK